MNQVIIKQNELENFLNYLEDKTDDIYKVGVKQAIERFLTEEVKSINGMIT